MGNWNSHPDQTVDRVPPMQFQDEKVAHEYYEEEAWLNEFAWMYIVGGVFIMFLIIGCCYCLCTAGGGSGAPAKASGYSVVSQSGAPAAQLSTADKLLYAGIPSKMPTMKDSKSTPGLYPTFSPAQSLKNAPPQYAYMPQQGYMVPQGFIPHQAYGIPPGQGAPMNYYGPSGQMYHMGQSFRAVPSEKAEATEAKGASSNNAASRKTHRITEKTEVLMEEEGESRTASEGKVSVVEVKKEEPAQVEALPSESSDSDMTNHISGMEDNDLDDLTEFEPTNSTQPVVAPRTTVVTNPAYKEGDEDSEKIVTVPLVAQPTISKGGGSGLARQSKVDHSSHEAIDKDSTITEQPVEAMVEVKDALEEVKVVNESPVKNAKGVAIDVPEVLMELKDESATERVTAVPEDVPTVEETVIINMPEGQVHAAKPVKISEPEVTEKTSPEAELKSQNEYEVIVVDETPNEASEIFAEDSKSTSLTEEAEEKSTIEVLEEKVEVEIEAITELTDIREEAEFDLNDGSHTPRILAVTKHTLASTASEDSIDNEHTEDAGKHVVEGDNKESGIEIERADDDKENETIGIQIESVKENNEIEDKENVDHDKGIEEVQTENIVGTREIVVGTPDIVIETPEVVPDTPDIVVGTPELVEESPEIVAGTPEVVPDTPDIVVGTPEIVGETAEIVIPETPDIVVEGREVVGGTAEIVAAAPKIVVGPPEMFAGTPASVAGTTVVVAATSDVVAETPEIVAGTPEKDPGETLSNTSTQNNEVEHIEKLEEVVTLQETVMVSSNSSDDTTASDEPVTIEINKKMPEMIETADTDNIGVKIVSETETQPDASEPLEVDNSSTKDEPAVDKITNESFEIDEGAESSDSDSSSQNSNTSEEDSGSDTDVEERINQTIQEMKEQLEVEDHLEVASRQRSETGKSDEDTSVSYYTDARDETITDVSLISSTDFASCETLDSIATLTDERVKDSRPTSIASLKQVFKETDLAMEETEVIIKGSYEEVVKALDDEAGGEYEEIASDLGALKLSTPRHQTKQIIVEKELGKIASDIDQVADNLQKSSSTENIISAKNA